MMGVLKAGGVAAVAASVAVVLIPALALAAPAVGVRAITIHAQPNPITAGDSVDIYGRLLGQRGGGRLVVLYHEPAGSSVFTPIQSTRSAADGSYEFTRADGIVVTNRSWYVAAAGLVSRTVTERVAAQVTLSATGPGGVPEPSGSTLQTGRGHSYTFSGTVSPSRAGEVVYLQRQSSSSNDANWSTIGRGSVEASGAFTIAHEFVLPSEQGGEVNIRVLLAPSAANIASPSDSLEYVIEQTQNPALTLQAASYVIAEGSTGALSGIDAAGAGRLLTLYGHVADQRWAPVATTLTGVGGAYSFTVSPVFNTLYRVVPAGAALSVTRGSATDSAVLFLGVRDALSTSVSQTTVKQGQPVTFSGTVAPNKTGQRIVLQRENAAGTAWHTIAVGTVGANSSYSLSWSFYQLGSEVVRVRIPGSDENVGAASAPITITVDPVPAASLPSAGSQ